MQGVVAVACDMNSDFQEDLQERCPHLQIVFDHFHIINTFNDKVVSPIRIEEQKRLIAEDNEEGAKLLKHGKHILTAKKSTLARKDETARKDKIKCKGNNFFKFRRCIAKDGNLMRYNYIILENQLLFTVDIIKEHPDEADQKDSPEEMKKLLENAVTDCNLAGNKHRIWFARLLTSHMEGIIGYTKYPISSGKMEGINGHIKEICR